MRAVNLMPLEGRAKRAADGGGDGGGFGVYALLGALAGLAVMAALWTLAGKQADDKAATLQQVNAETAAAEARATKAAPYVQFAQLAKDRVATVTSLSSTRFDFAHGLSELARVLPENVWLTAVTATSGAGAEAPSPTSNAAPAPRFELDGCTGTQSDVARLMARLRAVDGVRKVELSTSTKPDGGGGDCPANEPSNPTFKIAISFSVPGAPKAQVDATGQVTDPAQAPPATGGATDPAAAGTTPPAGETPPPAGETPPGSTASLNNPGAATAPTTSAG